ncbi:DNA-binding MarR family transcriptional regulator [Motilibacter peucedani]|uniref:DNA-binding MarR family transcriptional regulator n=2 Tax=Motilibacter peucedani TaxID=598650 RepID=A0A420XN77_9ACTN|nr:DNA-binding MarR family transcriptional regulator [Motilibacter peucedani]
MSVGREVFEQVNDQLAEHGLAVRHLAALGHLAGAPGTSYSELARRARVSPQSMQATLGQLEVLGLVVRATPPGRGRRAELQLTDEGRAAARRGRELFERLEQRMLAALDPADRAAVTAALVSLFEEVVVRGRAADD